MQENPVNNTWTKWEFNKEIEITKNEHQTEILKLKNTVNEMKNAIEMINTRMDQVEKKNCKVEDHDSVEGPLDNPVTAQRIKQWIKWREPT